MKEDMSTSPLVSVIVVSCLKNDLLRSCIDSILSQDYPNIECLVYLNCSDKSKRSNFESKYKNVKFRNSEDNDLFCKPLNSGIRESKGTYVLCLNDDIILSPDLIGICVNAMEKDPVVGILGCCLIRPDKKTFDSCGLLWHPSRKPYDRGYGLKDSGGYSRGFIFGVNGAAAFFRRKTLEDIKEGSEYFDERYGIYYEDMDISWRANIRGWRSFYEPSARAVHIRGASTRVVKRNIPIFLRNFAIGHIPHDLKVRLVRNRYITILKNDRLLLFLRDLPWILSYEIRLFFYLLFFDRAVLKDIVSDLSFIPYALNRRRIKYAD
ncbi:MAG TPA: glycosyltransferase [Candidatus Omnitrophota bacterium]|nr:glycosyltransferase [Candidatus Omnitrophota bacterium]